jgi:hypothetical protein
MDGTWHGFWTKRAGALLGLTLFGVGCSSKAETETQSGGASSGGSAESGGATSGGAASGGTTGCSVSGGKSSGGTGMAGASSGGSANGGSAGANGGAATDPCAEALFCEDFEKYALGSAPTPTFKVQTNSGAISVDGAQHASGSQSAKLTTIAKDGTKTALLRLEASSVFPVMGNVFYGRMMFRLEAAPTASVHWTLIQAGGLIAGQNYHSLYRYGGQQPVTQNNMFVGSQLMANYETPDSYSGTGPKSDCWFHANKRVVPVAKWSCVEWKFDGPNNQMRMWLDGVALSDLDVNGVGQGCVNQPATYAWTAPTFDHLDVGWESYQNDEARTLYIDDLIVSKSPIGCP